MVTRRGDEIGIVRILAGEFAAPPAHGDDGNIRIIGRRFDRREEVAVRVRVALEQNNVGIRSDGVGPFHVERFLDVPGPRLRVGGERRPSRLVEHFQRRVARRVELRQAEFAAEAVGVGKDVGVVIGVDDGNRLTGAGPRRAAETDRVDAIGRLHLGRINRSHARRRIRLGSRGVLAGKDERRGSGGREEQPALERLDNPGLVLGDSGAVSFCVPGAGGPVGARRNSRVVIPQGRQQAQAGGPGHSSRLLMSRTRTAIVTGIRRSNADWEGRRKVVRRS